MVIVRFQLQMFLDWELLEFQTGFPSDNLSCIPITAQ